MPHIHLADVLRYADFKTTNTNILSMTAEPWRGHIAFAQVLMTEARPEIFVELGCFEGVSFFAFCQAVKAENLSTRCCAVDTWMGDPHADYYGEEVYTAVKNTADSTYPTIAELIRCQFDDALPRFEDESIGILHIDGLHTYEAVRHDFDSWLPKVKPGGIVIMHDVCEIRDDFGVYKLWDEIVPQTSESYLFRHSHGLGVWRKPGGAPLETPLLKTLLSGDAEAAAQVDAYITGLATREISRIVAENMGAELEKRLGENGALQCEVKELKTELETRLGQVGALQWEVTALKNELGLRLGEVGALKAEVEAVVDDREAKLHTAEERLSQLRDMMETMLADRENQRISAEEKLGELSAEIATLSADRAELHRMLRSRSWKLTSPLRKMAGLMRSVIKPVRP